MTFTPSLGRRVENDRRSFPPAVSPVRYAWKRLRRFPPYVDRSHAPAWHCAGGRCPRSRRVENDRRSFPPVVSLVRYAWKRLRRFPPYVRSASLKRARQLQQMLGHVGKNQVGGDRRHLVQPSLAELALHVVFVGEAEAAVGLQAGVGRLPRGFRRQVLGHVGGGTGITPGVVFLAGAPAHQVGRLDLDVRFGDGELHALVLPDRTAEHHAVAGVLRRLLDEPATIADALG